MRVTGGKTVRRLDQDRKCEINKCILVDVSHDGDEVTSDSKSKSPWSTVMRMSGRPAKLVID